MRRRSIADLGNRTLGFAPPPRQETSFRRADLRGSFAREENIMSGERDLYQENIDAFSRAKWKIKSNMHLDMRYDREMRVASGETFQA
jgi:hypothetical protein